MKNRNDNQKPNGKPLKNWVIGLGIFCAVLLAANIWTITAYAPSKSNKNASTDQHDLLNPARKFVDQKDLIINFQPLRDYLNEKYEADPNVSIYFEYQPTGSNISINKDAEFYPASLLKVPVAMAVAKKIERGEWKWSNELVLMSADKDDRFGTLYKELQNSTHTIENLVRRSLSESDNTAHFMLVRNLEVSEIDDVYSHIGLKNFMKTDGRLSAKRYSVIFRSIYNSSYNLEGDSQKLISYLTESLFGDYIQRGLPEDVSFAHKIGISQEEKVFIDSGIVYVPSRPYILTVMIKDKTEEEAKNTMKDISEKVYTYVKNYAE